MFIALGVIILGWQMGSMALGKPFLPSPGAAFGAFFGLLFTGEMTEHFVVSAYRILASIGIALALGVPLGLAMGRVVLINQILGPMVYLLYPLPKAVFLPIIVVLMGLGNAPKIFLITMVIFFQIVVVTRDGAKNIPQASIDSMRSLNANWWQTYQHLIIPACLPQILTALRITLGTAIAVLFFAETFASFDGLGYFILEGMETRNYPAMYAGIIGMALLGVLLYLVVDFLAYKWCSWQKH